MINSAKMLLKLKTYDFDRILPQIQQWTDSLDNISSEDLKIYYYTNLQLIPQSEKFFIIDKIQKCKLMNSMIYCLIDWKYFAPSKPDKKSNWFEIKQVDQMVVQKFLEDEDNKIQMRELFEQTTDQYKNSIKWIVQMVQNQQKDVQQDLQQNIINQQYQQQLKELLQQIENLKVKLDDMQQSNKEKDDIIQQLQQDQQKLKNDQKDIVSSLKIVQINQKQYQKDVLSTIGQVKQILEKEEDAACKTEEKIIDEQQDQ